MNIRFLSSFDMMSTHSFRTDYSAVAATPITDYKTYPLHLLFTRCPFNAAPFWPKKFPEQLFLSLNV
jgi:hypothetical protein